MSLSDLWYHMICVHVWLVGLRLVVLQVLIVSDSFLTSANPSHPTCKEFIEINTGVSMNNRIAIFLPDTMQLPSKNLYWLMHSEFYNTSFLSLILIHRPILLSGSDFHWPRIPVIFRSSDYNDCLVTLSKLLHINPPTSVEVYHLDTLADSDITYS